MHLLHRTDRLAVAALPLLVRCCAASALTLALAI
jgi:hypothetical protein